MALTSEPKGSPVRGSRPCTRLRNSPTSWRNWVFISSSSLVSRTCRTNRIEVSVEKANKRIPEARMRARAPENSRRGEGDLVADTSSRLCCTRACFEKRVPGTGSGVADVVVVILARAAVAVDRSSSLPISELGPESPQHGPAGKGGHDRLHRTRQLRRPGPVFGTRLQATVDQLREHDRNMFRKRRGIALELWPQRRGSGDFFGLGLERSGAGSGFVERHAPPPDVGFGPDPAGRSRIALPGRHVGVGSDR